MMRARLVLVLVAALLVLTSAAAPALPGAGASDEGRATATGPTLAVVTAAAPPLLASVADATGWVLADASAQGPPVTGNSSAPASAPGSIAPGSITPGSVAGGFTLPGADLSGPMAQAQPRATWDWPLLGRPEVVKYFDPPPKPWLPGHRGIDLAGLQAARVLAVDDGTVTYSGSIAGIGIVSITHADGIRSTYQPVTDRVEKGATVARGERIGHLGDFGSHCLVRLCLHLGALRGETYLDPLLFLVPWELSLLPHDG